MDLDFWGCFGREKALSCNRINMVFQIGGVEVDLVRLYDVVQRYGGMKRILDKKKWMKVADAMKIPKQVSCNLIEIGS